MSDSLYMLRCPGRSYFARCTVILITSRDFAILLLYRCLRNSHTEHELRTIFSSSQLSQKRSKLSNCSFWKFSYKRKFFFLTHLLYAKFTLNNDRRLYRKRWCDQMRTWLFSSHWNRIWIALFEICRTDEEISFWHVLCMRNRHSTVIENYIRRDDVIRCELDSAFIDCCREERW
jgi:hypothetical protein